MSCRMAIACISDSQIKARSTRFLELAMSDEKALFFEDFTPGNRLEFGAHEITKDAIIAFAEKYDPQPFHLDEEAAQRSLLGGLAASGWQSCALAMRMVCDGFLNATDGRGAPGIDEVKWLKPVRPGMVLSMRADIVSTRISQSRPSIGLVQFRFDLHDASGTSLMVQDNFIMIGRRGHKHAVKKPAPRQAITTALLPFDQPGLIPAWSEMKPGQRIVLGETHFSAESIIGFAQDYDPQPFHLDRAAADTGPFGGLAASGWQTAAEWMRCMVETRQRSADAARDSDQKAPVAGPSPGFTNLRWLKPVLEGDTITFDTVLLEKRVTSRPGWGLVKSHNSGINQQGAKVFEFDSVAFWKAD